MKLIETTWKYSKACFTRGDYGIGITSIIFFPFSCWVVWWIEGITEEQ